MTWEGSAVQAASDLDRISVCGVGRICLAESVDRWCATLLQDVERRVDCFRQGNHPTSQMLERKNNQHGALYSWITHGRLHYCVA
eukprot:12906703-Prorocentrum_lima.AAC.1